jgi:voltage-gated potassium channel Kch
MKKSEQESDGIPYTLIGKLTRKCPWTLIIILVVVAVLLVIVGLVALAFDLPEEYREKIFDYAQYLGVAGTVLGSIKAYWNEIRRKYILVRLQSTSGHVVVCGLGEKGKRLVDNFLHRGAKIAVIESTKDHPDIPGCWERGVAVITGDAADAGVLGIANAGRAGFLLAVTGDDNTNIEIARKTYEVIKAVSAGGEQVNVRCHCHVASPSIREIFSHHELFEKTHDSFDASMFSVYDAAARFVLEKYPPDLLASQQKVAGSPIRILVIGFGAMGEALIKQTARISHYLDHLKVEITIVDKSVCAASERFLATYGDGKSPPCFVVPGISLRFVERDPESLATITDFMPASETKPVVTYMALDDDSRSVSLAVRLRAMFGGDESPVVICMKSDMSKLMEDDAFPFTSTRSIHAFNIFDFACAHPVLMEEFTDEIARLIHKAYLDSQSADKASTNLSLVVWRELTEDLKDSNRWQADHLSVKLRAIGFESDGMAALDRATGNPELLERLAEMEHRRWSAALLMDGWRYAPGAKDPLRKTHRCLVPYDELSDNEKAKDDTMIRNIMNLVASPAWERYQKNIQGTQ